jgi:polysaccharide pyruvyl transferase WcaK-like protein
MPFHQEQDMEFSLSVMRSMNVKPMLTQWKEFNDIYETIGSADLIISQRLHGLILALLYGIPVIGISADSKIDRFLKELGQKNISLLTEDNFYQVLAVILDTWEWRDEFKKHAKKLLPDFRGRAKKNSELPFLPLN